LQVVLGGGGEGVEASPGEPANESFVDIGQAGVGEVVAQVCVTNAERSLM
jgi:hypothetical protein